MKLIVIYGPPAAGKLTVAYELAKITGFKVFQNHAIINCVADVFPYGSKQEPSLKRLSKKFRLEIFQEAAIKNVNVITTYGGGEPQRSSFFKELMEIIYKNKGEIFFIQLVPSREALYERVSNESRKGVKINSQEFLKNLLDKEPAFFKQFDDIDHLVIDNSKLSPLNVAKRICEYYSL